MNYLFCGLFPFPVAFITEFSIITNGFNTIGTDMERCLSKGWKITKFILRTEFTFFPLAFHTENGFASVVRGRKV